MGNTERQKTTTFEMDAVETERANAFCNRHRAHAVMTSAGEAFMFGFIPTMLGGECVSVTCLACGETEDITDLDKF